MKKPAIFILAAAAILAAILALNSYGGGSKSGDDDDTVVEQSTTTEETDQQPEQVNVVIDKSASMKGYFNKGEMTPLLNTISEIANSGKKEGSVRFYEGNAISNYASALQGAAGFGKDTDMKAILEKLLTEADSVPVAFITDGIVSSKGGSDDFSQMRMEIKRLLEKADLGYVVYRINSPYKGSYWIEQSRLKNYHSQNISVVNRPLFVILMGPKKEIRYLRLYNPIKEKFEAMAFNTHDNHENLTMYYSDNNVFKEEDGKYTKVGSVEKYEFGFQFPKCLRDRIEKLSPENAKLTLNGTELKKWTVKLQPGSDNIALLYIPNKGPNESEPFDEEAMKEDESELELEFETADFNSWNAYHSDNDSTIATDINEQAKTFGLKYLIEAFREAQDNEEVKVSFKFTNE